MYDCPFCTWTDQFGDEARGLAFHLLQQHSVNALGSRHAPRPRGCVTGLRYVGGKNHRVFCFCNHAFQHQQKVAAFFQNWASANTPFVDHLEKVGGMIAHLETIKLDYQMHRVAMAGQKMSMREA